nr:hypothetical protein [Tanacetum cinerariifolium]
MGKTINELHAMLKLRDQTLPKNNAPALYSIRAGKVQKVNKHKKLQPQMAARGENHRKGKNKLAYAPKPETPPPSKREDLVKGSICHECGIFTIELNTFLNRSWIYDTGCGTHICNTMQGLRASSKLKPEDLSLYVGNGQREVVKAIGVFYLCLLSGLEIVLNNCHYALSITRGVISVSRLYEDDFINRFVNNTTQVSRNNMIYFNDIPWDGIFEIDLSNSYANDSSMYAISNKRAKLDLDSALLWHCRLRHISKKRIEKLQHDGILNSTDLRAFEKCVSCMSRKMARKPYKHQVERAKDLLGLIHTDVCGPFKIMSRQGASYFVTFTNDFSRYGCVYLLKHKYEVFETFKLFQKEVENQLGKTIKSLRSDRGGEYMSQEFLDHLKDHGIIAHRTPPYTPQHNRVSERKNKTLLDMVEKTPYEVWHGQASKMSYLKVWGCEALVKRDTLTKPDKLEPKSIKCIFKSLIIQEANGSQEDLEIIQEKNTYPSIDTCLNHEEDDLKIDEPQSDIIPIRRYTRICHPTDRMFLYIDAEEHELGDLGEPSNYKAALLDPESNKWLNAMNVEMQSMEDNKVWDLVEVPPNGKTVGSKWLFKKKTDMNGAVHTNKARLVANGYTQTPEIDYEETLSPVADIRAIRILIAITAFYDNEIWQMDVKTAFLNGYLFEEVYMEQPEGEAAYILGIKIHRDRSWRLIGASTPAELKRMQNVSYASAVGSIMYAVRCTNPDVMFAQNITSRFQQNPGDLHWTTVNTILKYLRNTKDMFLVYEGITKGARHFRAKVHYLREVIEYGDVKSEKVYTDDNLANPFTKALSFSKHSKHTKNIGMLPANSLILGMKRGFLSQKGSRVGSVVKKKQSSMADKSVEVSKHVNEALDSNSATRTPNVVNARLESFPTVSEAHEIHSPASANEENMNDVGTVNNVEKNGLMVGPTLAGNTPGSWVDVVVSVESIRDIRERFANTTYGFFLGKRNPDVNLSKEDVGNILVWVKLHDVPGRSSYARTLIEIRADVELKDNIMVAMPKLVEEKFYTCTIRVEYE